MDELALLQGAAAFFGVERHPKHLVRCGGLIFVEVDGSILLLLILVPLGHKIVSPEVVCKLCVFELEHAGGATEWGDQVVISA